ncbi:hypothetical protein DSM3645_19833 [Blastopirellula marina DSM 3645]|uniref:Uncharacterized protein n=1 Tax=Blastopirellula marina DSM 3645 TaxID=314230 RepID=A3ZTL6_9BACT|nr:hypothetical protein DSM3645_19833 [Blastopirellula marina DSM 3645]
MEAVYAKPFWLLLWCGVLCMSMGAGCPAMLRPMPVNNAPIAFATQPTLEQVIAQVNGNTARVQTAETTGATISLHGFPAIRANISMAPPLNFRLTGEAALMGQVLDFGSNNEEFWAWSTVDGWPGLVYCRHDQYQYSNARQLLPVEPTWISQAMGLVIFEPGGNHQGPYPTPDGNLEIRTQISGPSGTITKSTVIDKTYGFVLQQHVYDQAGNTLASALASAHRFDPTTGVSLPHRIDLKLPPAQMEFTINVYDYRINQPPSSPNVFMKPQRSDARSINLADPNLQMMPPGNAPPAASAGVTPGYIPSNGYPAQPQPAYQAAPPTSYPVQPYNTMAPPVNAPVNQMPSQPTNYLPQAQYDAPRMRGFDVRR